MAHDHHGHAHGHHHHSGSNIGLAFVLNTIFAFVELVGGLLTNSVAILSDSLHDFGDSLSLGVAWYFERRSRRGRDEKFSYGYQRFSLVGAFITSTVLIVGSILIIQEAIPRLIQPERADYKGMIVLACLGIVVNLIAMMRLKKGTSISERAVFLHFLEDVLGWIAVLAGAFIMLFFDVPIIDPILSILIALYVLFNVYRNIAPAFRILLQGTPSEMTEEEVKQEVLSDPRIADVHDIRMWSLDGSHHVISLHLVTRSNFDLDTAQEIKEEVKSRLRKLHIVHSTIEVEFDPRHCSASS